MHSLTFFVYLTLSHLSLYRCVRLCPCLWHSQKRCKLSPFQARRPTSLYSEIHWKQYVERYLYHYSYIERASSDQGMYSEADTTGRSVKNMAYFGTRGV